MLRLCSGSTYMDGYTYPIPSHIHNNVTAFLLPNNTKRKKNSIVKTTRRRRRDIFKLILIISLSCHFPLLLFRKFTRKFQLKTNRHHNLSDETSNIQICFDTLSSRVDKSYRTRNSKRTEFQFD